MKKLFIIPALVIAIGGGYLLAQTGLLSGNAENHENVYLDNFTIYKFT